MSVLSNIAIAVLGQNKMACRRMNKRDKEMCAKCVTGNSK